MRPNALFAENTLRATGVTGNSSDPGSLRARRFFSLASHRPRPFERGPVNQPKAVWQVSTSKLENWPAPVGQQIQKSARHDVGLDF